MPIFRQAIHLPFPKEVAFAYHERPGAFERLAPPWQHCRVVSRQGGIRFGDVIVLEIGIWGPLKRKWTIEHRDYQLNQQFSDFQLQGPFKRWYHTHLFSADADDPQASTLSDLIDYELPFGNLGTAIAGAFVERNLRQLFAYRHRITQHDLKFHTRFERKPKMRIAITGSSGLVGSTLIPLLTTAGHTVISLVRGVAQNSAEVQWNPVGPMESGELEKLEGIDAVVHLAGENIAAGRWSSAQMARIRDSRINGTRHLVQALCQLQNPPRVFIGASAIGIYGDRGAELLPEDAPSGTGFLAKLCQEWESECQPLESKGMRIINARFGVILSPQGGALKKMLLPFKMGAGGILGSGRQYFPWIALDDVVSILFFLLMDDAAAGPINLVAPQAVTNAEFTKTLGRVLRRPTILPMPAFAAKLAFSKGLAEQLLLASANVCPTRLQDLSYDFRHPNLEDALRHLLGRSIVN